MVCGDAVLLDFWCSFAEIFILICCITTLFTNMRILKFKSQLTIAFFAAVNHLNGPLKKQNFTLMGSKGHGLWFAIGGFRSVLCVSVFQVSLLVIIIMIDSSEKRNCEGGFWILEFACLKIQITAQYGFTKTSRLRHVEILRLGVFLCYSVRCLYVYLCGFVVFVPPLRPPPNSTLKLNLDTLRYQRTEQLQHPETQNDLPMNGLKNCMLLFRLFFALHLKCLDAYLKLQILSLFRFEVSFIA